MTLNRSLTSQAVFHDIRSKHLLGSWKCFLKLCISLFLDRLCVLQLFDKFHLEHFHLHDFLLFHGPHTCLIVQFAIDVAMYWMNATFFILLNFQLSETFLLYDDLILELVILFSLHLNGLSTLLQLCFNSFWLLSLLSLWQVYRLLDLPLLILPLLLDHVIRLRIHLLRLDIHLQIDNFLYKNAYV